MARSFITRVQELNGANNATTWKDEDGTITLSGTYTVPFGAKVWYSRNATHLIVAVSAGLRAYPVDQTTGLPTTTSTPDFQLNTTLNPVNVNFSDDKSRIVSAAADTIAFFTFSESSGFASEGTVDISAFNAAQASYAQFVRNTNDAVLVVSNYVSSGVPYGFLKLSRSDSTWTSGITIRTQPANTYTIRLQAWDAVALPNDPTVVRIGWFRRTDNTRHYQENNLSTGALVRQGTAGTATRTPVNVQGDADGKYFHFAANDGGGLGDVVVDWPLDAAPANTFAVSNVNDVSYMRYKAQSPRDIINNVAAGVRRAAIGRWQSAATFKVGLKNAVASGTNGVFTGSGGNNTTAIDWSHDVSDQINTTLDGDLPAMTGAFEATAPHLFIATSLPALTAALNGKFGWRAEIASTLPAMTGAAVAWQTIAAQMAGTLSPVSASFVVEELQPADLPGVEVHTRGEWDRVIGTAPVAEHEFPFFGYFDSAALPALTAAFAAEPSNMLMLEAVLPGMRSNGLVSFPLESNLTTSFPALVADFEGTADSERDVELEATLPALRSDILVWHDIAVDLVTSLPQMSGSFSASQAIDAEMESSLAAMTGDLLGYQTKIADLNGVMAPMVFEGEGEVVFALRMPAVLPTMTGEFEGTADTDDSISLEAVLPAMTSSVEVWQDIAVFDLGTLPAMQMSGEVTVPFAIFGLGTLPALSAEFDVAGSYKLTMAATLPSMIAAGEIDVPLAAFGLGTMASMTGEFEGTADNSRDVELEARFPALRSDIEVWHDIEGDLDGILPKMTASLLAFQLKEGLLSAVLPTMTGDFASEADIGGYIITSLPALRSEIIVGVPASIDMNARLPRMEMAVRAGWPVESTLNAQLPALTGGFLAAQPYTVALEGFLPSMTAAIVVEGLPSENGLAPVDFGGIGGETQTINVNATVVFGFGVTFP